MIQYFAISQFNLELEDIFMVAKLYLKYQLENLSHLTFLLLIIKS